MDSMLPTAPPVSTEASTWLSVLADGATVLAAIATLVAAVIAFFTIRQTRKLHTEKSQPYVVASLEPHEHVPWIFELVVRNLGQTSAADVVMTIDPQPMREMTSENGEPKPVLFPSSFPVLVPGQRWGSTWDSIFQRNDSDLPKEYKVIINYKGIDGEPQKATESVLSWDTYLNRGHLDIKNLNNVAQELRGINSKLDRMLRPGLVHQVELCEVDEEGRQAVPLSRVVQDLRGRSSDGSIIGSLTRWVRAVQR